ncbi:uncharacterized protein [Triticum aestivum]|uniref:uncharacterized protein n=1 Tax=Triticum aestivum TaxID=4565 RepID=UPI001D02D18B|nr:uncharacterized protein LOC123133535 [Triticum aestivum]
MEDGESYKSWAWWLDALQAMRRTYSIPMDAEEARIRADIDFDNARRKVCRAEAEEARRKDQLLEEEEAVRCWAKTGDPEAEAYREGLDDLLQEMTERMSSEERDEWSTTPDRESFSSACYRHQWSSAHRRGAGSSYEDTTGIPAMQFTDAEPEDRWDARPTGTLQIFSFKVAAIDEELRWPLEVYGLIAIRDHLDRSRNVIFARGRDNCQTISSMDPYLTLAGPTRAPVVSEMSNSVRFEVVLKVKSSTNESEDKDLSFLAAKFRTFYPNYSRVIKWVATSKLSRLEWAFAVLAKSVEATISIQVIHGSWLDGCRGIFSASTVSLDGRKVHLLSLEDGKLPVTTDGMINLSRNVACVEINGRLKISVAIEYTNGEQVTAEDETIFRPRKFGTSCAILMVRSCEMKVIVHWSLVTTS